MRWTTIFLLAVIAFLAIAYWNVSQSLEQSEAQNLALEAERAQQEAGAQDRQEQASSRAKNGGGRISAPNSDAQNIDDVPAYDESRNAAVVARQQAQLRAMHDYNASQSKICEPGSKSYKHISDSIVRCGCEYTSYQHSRDGTTVCTGGRYKSYQHSRDGSDVACGWQYGSYQHSRDGHRICAGGKYGSYQHSRDGTRVACGGQYKGSQKSRDGSMTCFGGRYRR
jgi:hypothetical protein